MEGKIEVVLDEGEIFKKSKMVLRSPEKKEEGDELVKKIMDGMRKECGRIEKRVEESKEGAKKERGLMKKKWEEERTDVGG